MNRIEMAITLFVTISIYITALVITIKRIKDKKRRQIPLGILYVIAIVLVVLYSYYTSCGNYDRYGNRNSSFAQVIYYAQDGKKYRMQGDFNDLNAEIYFINISNSQDRHKEKNSFINKKGYIFFDDSGQKVKSANKSNDVALYIDGNGQRCYDARCVQWGWTGGMTGTFWWLK